MPFSDSYCYAFPQPLKLFCYPVEVFLIPLHYIQTEAANLTHLDLLVLPGCSAHLMSISFDSFTLSQTLSRSEKRYYDEKPFVKVTALELDLEHGGTHPMGGTEGMV